MNAFNDEDRAPLDDVEQRAPTDPVPPVPVELSAAVRVEQYGTRLAVVESVELVDGAGPVRILDADDRRARVTLWATGDDVLVAPTRGQATGGRGAIISGAMGVPYHFGFIGELWAATAPTATANATISFVTEHWTR